MARNAFGRGGSDGPSSLSDSPSVPGALTAFIDQGSQFEGKLTFKDTVRIDGRFQGEISSENTLIIGESGEIQATIRSKTVVVSGTVIGDMHASRQVVLHKSSRVEGNINTASIVIEEGATLNGQVKMNVDGEKGKNAAPLKAIEGAAPAPSGAK